MVKSRRRASSSAVPKTLSRRISRSWFSLSRARLAGLFLRLAGVGAEGGRLDDLRAEEDVRQAEAAADDAAVAKQPPDLVGRGAGGDVEVLGLAAEQQVAHAAADQVGGVIEAAQPQDHLGGVGVDLIRNDLHEMRVSTGSTRRPLRQERRCRKPLKNWGEGGRRGRGSGAGAGRGRGASAGPGAGARRRRGLRRGEPPPAGSAERRPVGGRRRTAMAGSGQAPQGVTAARAAGRGSGGRERAGAWNDERRPGR